jgi:hypothetical protein
MNDASDSQKKSKIGLGICLAIAFSILLSYAVGGGFALSARDNPGANGFPGGVIPQQVFLAVVVGGPIGTFVRWIMSRRPAWMGALITVCSIAFLFGFYPGSKVVPRQPLLFPLTFIAVIFSVAYVPLPKIKARQSKHGP